MPQAQPILMSCIEDVATKWSLAINYLLPSHREVAPPLFGLNVVESGSKKVRELRARNHVVHVEIEHWLH